MYKDKSGARHAHRVDPPSELMGMTAAVINTWQFSTHGWCQQIIRHHDTSRHQCTTHQRKTPALHVINMHLKDNTSSTDKTSSTPLHKQTSHHQYNWSTCKTTQHSMTRPIPDIINTIHHQHITLYWQNSINITPTYINTVVYNTSHNTSTYKPSKQHFINVLTQKTTAVMSSTHLNIQDIIT